MIKCRFCYYTYTSKKKRENSLNVLFYLIIQRYGFLLAITINNNDRKNEVRLWSKKKIIKDKIRAVVLVVQISEKTKYIAKNKLGGAIWCTKLIFQSIYILFLSSFFFFFFPLAPCFHTHKIRKMAQLSSSPSFETAWENPFFELESDYDPIMIAAKRNHQRQQQEQQQQAPPRSPPILVPSESTATTSSSRRRSVTTEENPLKIIALGKTGDGKSSLLNDMLGREAFKHKRSVKVKKN